MKKTWINIASIVLLTCTALNSCDFTSSNNYMGTMAGAEIGGVVGEALGWMSTDRHDGPGKAMLGSVIGTVAGAVIGNAITKDRPKYDNNNYYDNQTYEYSERDNYRRNDNDDYQTGGGYSNNYIEKKSRANRKDSHSYNYNDYSSFVIKNIYFEDEDGDGRVSRNETVNIIYEVTNTSNIYLNDVVLKVEAVDCGRNFALSPATTVNIAPGETLRYKAKAFCKSKPSFNTATFRVSANNAKAGNASAELQIRMNK